MLYVQKNGPTARSNCTYRCHFALPGHFCELYVQKIGLALHSNCTYRLDNYDSRARIGPVWCTSPHFIGFVHQMRGFGARGTCLRIRCHDHPHFRRGRDYEYNCKSEYKRKRDVGLHGSRRAIRGAPAIVCLVTRHRSPSIRRGAATDSHFPGASGAPRKWLPLPPRKGAQHVAGQNDGVILPQQMLQHVLRQK